MPNETSNLLLMMCKIFLARAIVLARTIVVGPLPRVRPRNGILALLVVVVVPLRSEFIGEL